MHTDTPIMSPTRRADELLTISLHCKQLFVKPTPAMRPEASTSNMPRLQALAAHMCVGLSCRGGTQVGLNIVA